jgi:hypothetical protein
MKDRTYELMNAETSDSGSNVSAQLTHLGAVEDSSEVSVNDLLPLLGLHAHEQRVTSNAWKER